jgi:cation:H+ antiporter
MISHYVALLFGVICAGIGGELFVRGTVGLAHWSRISPGIVAATVAAFATSSPELSVSISSAIAGKPQIALGDALGSNVVNVALILGTALAISGIQGSRAGVKRDLPVALLVPIITGILCLDGEISRIDGMLMLCAFFAWLVATVIEARNQRSAAEEVLGAQQAWVAAAYCAGGLAFLIVAGYSIVSGARGIALHFGVAEFIIGATVVAVGTSVPELATAIVAKLRGHDEVGLGTILGSNIFNGLFIVAVAAIIHPITIGWREVFGTLAFGVVALLCSYPSRTGFIERRRGFLLLVLYAVYLTTILQMGAK